MSQQPALFLTGHPGVGKSAVIKAVVSRLGQRAGGFYTFLQPMMTVLPDKRLQQVVPLAVRGILGSETPIVTKWRKQWPGLKVECGQRLNGFTGF